MDADISLEVLIVSACPSFSPQESVAKPPILFCRILDIWRRAFCLLQTAIYEMLPPGSEYRGVPGPITMLLAHPHRNKKVPDDGRCKLL